MEPIDGEARARWLREEIAKKVVTLRRLREERLVIRAQTAPHLRRLLDERIESVSRELENALPCPSLLQPPQGVAPGSDAPLSPPVNLSAPKGLQAGEPLHGPVPRA